MKERKDSRAISLTSVSMGGGSLNYGYVNDDDGSSPLRVSTIERVLSASDKLEIPISPDKTGTERPQWSNGLEFLMSCIAMSVGLGNIWRFPFTAYENGGGAFLIPYVIVLVAVGRPLYLLEMALGQFTSKGAVKMWCVTPIFIGVGYGQIISNACVLTYYCALMAITLHYLVASFQSELPWSSCKPEWENCFDAVRSNESAEDRTFALNRTGLVSSSELYFFKEVLHEKSQIHDGIGLPDWQLTLYLFVSWLIIFFVLMRGVQSSGKAAYFLALFPYVVLTCLLIRGVTLPGALNGILFFFTPQWNQLLNPKVWYAAVTQAFYSLTVCFGALISYASFNDFRHNIYRDAMIVTVLDTFTSLMAGCTIFGILGNLAYESGTTDISTVTKGGTGLAFISYPDAIAKFQVVPQVFSVLFFFMLYVLGIGSAISCHGAIVTLFSDLFPKIKYWKIALVGSILGFLGGLIYITPGGQYMLNLVDYFAVSFSLFVLASVETIAVLWIYGIESFCDDIEFMLESKIGAYWRICWGFFTPVLLMVILIYSIALATPLKYGDYIYPDSAYACGWLLMTIGIAQIPLWGWYVVTRESKASGQSIWSSFRSCFQPDHQWGPADPVIKKQWEQNRLKKREERRSWTETKVQRILRIAFNYSKNGNTH